MYPLNSKTFWIGVVCIALGVVDSLLGDKDGGVQLILLGLGFLGVRDAVRKVERSLRGGEHDRSGLGDYSDI